MSRPNIILIVSDDHGYADRSVLGIRPDVQTPALDRLASEGVTFTDGYVTAPICSPSRSGIMTGLYQQRWGNLWFDTAQFPPDDSVPTLAEILRDAGYRTGYFGKVHYGPEDVGDRACPPHHGFETTLYGLAGQSKGRLNYLRHSTEAQAEYGEAAMTMAVQPLLSGDDPVEFEGFLTDEFGRRAIEFIEDPDERPFFCMLAFNAVHNFCWQLPAEELERRGLPSFDDWNPDEGQTYGEWYDDVIVPNLPHGREYYLAQLELMDAQIGAVLDRLDELGVGRDTLVVYTTDNGGSTCNYGDNAPLRGTKYTLWEGGIRVPMIWRWPGTLPAGEERSTLASALDLMPTLREIGGSNADDMSDGVSLLPSLLHAAAQERSLHWECGFQFAVRDGAWKLSWVEPGNEMARELEVIEHAPMGRGWHLSNLDQDPGEQVNLFEDHLDVAAELLRRHETWRQEVGLAPRATPEWVTS